MKKYLALAVFCLIGNAAMAGVVLEPYAGYEMGQIACVTNTSTNCDSKNTGVIYGGRLGIKSMRGFWIAAEYEGSSTLTSKPDDGGTSSNLKHTALGGTIGYDSFGGYRIFAGYNFQDTLVTTAADGAETTLKDGSSYHFGIGYRFHMLPMALNFGYWVGSYKKVESSGITSQIEDSYSKIKPVAYTVTLSFPFELM